MRCSGVGWGLCGLGDGCKISSGCGGGERCGFCCMGRGTTQDGAEIRAFAAAQGIAERTARNYRKEGRPEWREWCSRRGVSAVSEGAGVGSEVERAEAVREAAYAALERLNGACATAPPEQLPVLIRAAADARKAWEAACRHAEEAGVNAGRLVPVKVIRAMQSELVAPLGQALRAWEHRMAGLMPPEVRPLFFNAVRSERVVLDARIKAIDERVEGLLRGCA